MVADTTHHERRSSTRFNIVGGDRVAVARWGQHDAMACAIERELRNAGLRAQSFCVGGSLPEDVELVLSFAPYGSLGGLMRQLEATSPSRRPRWVHWSMECFPAMHLPWQLLSRLGRWRAHAEAWRGAEPSDARSGIASTLVRWPTERFIRYRILGEQLRGLRCGLMTKLVESSAIHADIYSAHGIGVAYVPWGMPEAWQADLDLDRDIDVLWLGKRRTRRRSRLLDRVRGELSREGLEFYVADGVERPFVFGEERTRLVNRSKVMLNLLPRWYDTAFLFRFVHAAANGSLVISEPIQPHCPEIKPGRHFHTAPKEKLSRRIAASLSDMDRERETIAAARNLVRGPISLRESIRRLITVIES